MLSFLVTIANSTNTNDTKMVFYIAPIFMLASFGILMYCYRNQAIVNDSILAKEQLTIQDLQHKLGLLDKQCELYISINANKEQYNLLLIEQIEQGNNEIVNNNIKAINCNLDLLYAEFVLPAPSNIISFDMQKLMVLVESKTQELLGHIEKHKELDTAGEATEKKRVAEQNLQLRQLRKENGLLKQTLFKDKALESDNDSFVKIECNI
jgi:hypothetical protein